MKRLLFALVLVAPMSANAGELPATVTLSGPLVEEIFRALAARPYSEVAVTISKLTSEVQHQTEPVPAPKIVGRPK